MMYLDGVYTFEQEKAKFHFLTAPSSSELHNLLKSIAQRIVKLLEKRGWIVQDEGGEDKYLDLKSDEPMDYIHGSSVTYRIALGKYKGQKALSLKNLPNPKDYWQLFQNCDLHFPYRAFHICYMGLHIWLHGFSA